MSKKNLVNVDKGRLYACLKARGLTKTKASVEIGFSENYLSNCCHYGAMNAACAILLDRVYGIKREEYEIKDAPKGEAESNAEATAADREPLTKDELYQTIYAAVYHALKAWSE